MQCTTIRVKEDSAIEVTEQFFTHLEFTDPDRLTFENSQATITLQDSTEYSTLLIND